MPRCSSFSPKSLHCDSLDVFPRNNNPSLAFCILSITFRKCFEQCDISYGDLVIEIKYSHHRTRKSLSNYSLSNHADLPQDFYNPIKEDMKEPRLTGTSFSFTDDGYFEEALYLAISNRKLQSTIFALHNPGGLWIFTSIATSPSCPKAIMQWQHGKYKITENGSLILHPIAVDGRQLLSDPCKYPNSIYTRFNTTEIYNVHDNPDS